MKRIITYMVQYYDGSFKIKNDVFEKLITESNIQNLLGDKEIGEQRELQETYSTIPDYIVKGLKCFFISVTTLEE